MFGLTNFPSPSVLTSGSTPLSLSPIPLSVLSANPAFLVLRPASMVAIQDTSLHLSNSIVLMDSISFFLKIFSVCKKQANKQSLQTCLKDKQKQNKNKTTAKKPFYFIKIYRLQKLYPWKWGYCKLHLENQFLEWPHLFLEQSEKQMWKQQWNWDRKLVKCENWANSPKPEIRATKGS